MQNPMRWAVGVLLLLVLAGASYWLVSSLAKQPEPIQTGDAPKHPKLVVLVVFDQMRGDYPKKWEALYGDGGFKRLQKDGASFTNCHYPYAYTLTAPGHASLVTGTTPSKHGIIANEWLDRSIGGESVASTTPPPEEKKNGGGPYRLKAESVGDVLMRLLTGRVASLSIKERSAVFLAALRANLCYWFSSSSGNFVTSNYYRPAPHSWATKFNKGRMADQWLDKTWERFHPNLKYDDHTGPDDFAFEGNGYRQGQVFPHKLQLGNSKDTKANKKNFYDAVTCSPMGNDLLLAFAKTAIESEKLGQTESVDLLCVSFSSNDLIGHAWGPDSHEVLDVTLRTDALIKDFLTYLDEKVGKDNYYFALSADHGVSSMPEYAAKNGKKAGRVHPQILTSQAEKFLNEKFLPEGKAAPWLIVPEKGSTGGPWIYLNEKTIAELKLKQADVERALADWLNTKPGIERAFTRTELMREETKEQTELFRQMQRSFHPACSGDVMVALKPYHMLTSTDYSKNPAKDPTYRATHGSPHADDTHVPLMVLGPRIVPGVRDGKVTPQAMASILAEALGVPAPKDATYRLPEGLFKK